MLVILGLLVGGVLSGQSLIRAAELRSVPTQYQKFYSATMAFKDKYFAIPGDFNNAQAFWGIAHATPANCVTTASTSALTCNGDGGGTIYPSAGSNEFYRFWQHLANAGLIEGQYDGITHGTTIYSSTAANSPAGKIGSSLWFVGIYGSVSGLSDLFDGEYGNVFAFGGVLTDTQPLGNIFKAEELWNIDTKIDDGKPATGKVVSRTLSGLSACTTTVTNNPTTLSAEYKLSSTSPTCAAIFRNQF